MGIADYHPRNRLEEHLLATGRFDEYVFGWPDFATYRKAEGLGHPPAILFLGNELVTREAR